MKNLKVIKTQEDYQKALAAIDKILAIAAPTPDHLDELELLSILVEDYESKTMPVDLPDPIEAIKFRMEQDGLTRKDLQKYIGSASKVSEVLNRKVDLSLKMMRALHEGLGIPAEVLMQEPGKTLPAYVHMADQYPFNAMFKNGYFDFFAGTLNEAKEKAEELLNKFFDDFTIANQVFCKKSDKNTFDSNALSAWHCRICKRLADVEIAPFNKEILTSEFFNEVARLSFFDYGPEVVAKHLNKFGIHLIFEKHLPKTYLDGAAFLLPNGHPVIALTLRHERIDNFWFTLLHELAHIKLHLSDNKTAFFDDIAGRTCDSVSDAEQEANKMAENALVPESIWAKEKQALLSARNIGTIKKFAEKYQVALPIVIGKIHWETQRYNTFTNYLGNIHDYLPGNIG